MSRVDGIITQLDLLNEKAKHSTKKQVSEQDCRKTYDQICAFLPKATLDERVDIHIAFEDREELIATLLVYETRLAQQAAHLADKDKYQEAIRMLEQALIADAVIDGRASLEELQKVQNQLLKVAEDLHYDVETFLKTIATPAGAFVERAYLFQKQEKRAQAIRALGRALQLDHTLRYNEKIADFAKLLTNEPPYSAVMLLEDSFLRNSLIKDIERQIKRQQQGKTQTAEVTKADNDDNILKRVLGGVFNGRRS